MKIFIALEIDQNSLKIINFTESSLCIITEIVVKLVDKQNSWYQLKIIRISFIGKLLQKWFIDHSYLEGGHPGLSSRPSSCFSSLQEEEVHQSWSGRCSRDSVHSSHCL